MLFTLDGRLPTPQNAIRYDAPISLSADQPQVVVVRAMVETVAGTSLRQSGPVVSHSFFLNIPATMPLLSLIIEPDDFWGEERGIYVNFEGHGQAWERAVDLVYVDADRQSGFHVPAGARIHGRGSRPLEKKSLRLYFRQEYGASRLEYPLFAASDVQSFKRLVVHNGGQDEANFHVNWTHMRNQIAANLAHAIGSNATHSQPALVFINGESWGIYQIRERLDEYFLADHYALETADMLDTPEELVRTDHIVLGSRQHWDEMMAFVLTNDLTDPENYAYLGTQMDIANYIDYNLIQMYIANDDWPSHNMRVFRSQASGGRWQWLFWDTDRSFAFGPGAGPAEKDMMAHVLINEPSATGRQVILLQKLWENQSFRNVFLVRLGMLLNFELSTEQVLAQVDGLAAQLAEDIQWETARWQTDKDAWVVHVEQLRDFARRRPALMRQHVRQAFELPSMVRLQLQPSLNGVIVLEDQVVDEEWAGQFFAGSIVQITAVPAPHFQFMGWQELDGPVSLDLGLVEDQTLTPIFEPIADEVARVGDVVITAVTPDFVELQTNRTVDLRGWRLTDNDTIAGTGEGSLIFADDPALAEVVAGSLLQIRWDDVTGIDGTIVLTERNGRLEGQTDAGFQFGEADALILLAPGKTAVFADDVPIVAFTAQSNITPLMHQFYLPTAAIKTP